LQLLQSWRTLLPAGQDKGDEQCGAKAASAGEKNGQSGSHVIITIENTLRCLAGKCHRSRIQILACVQHGVQQHHLCHSM
jgi:hypothetical protein